MLNNCFNNYHTQGEIIDEYLKEDHEAMIQISSFSHIGTILSCIISAQLYVSGGWVLVGFGMASFNIILIVLIPFFKTLEMKDSIKVKAQTSSGEKQPLVQNNCYMPQAKLSWQRTIAYYCPDIVLFLNNLVNDLMNFVLPPRIVNSTEMSLTAAVSLFHTYNVFSLLSALILSFFAVRMKKFGVLKIMAIGNLVYFGGNVLAFGATTRLFRFLDTTTQLVVGLVLIGVGEPFYLNYGISCKFSLYEKWGVGSSGLGEQGSRINNMALNLASAKGTVFSALSLSDESDIPTVAALSGLGVLLTMAILICSLVR